MLRDPVDIHFLICKHTTTHTLYVDYVCNYIDDQALVGAPGASVERVKSLWPAILGLLIGLEALDGWGQGTEGVDDEGDGGITAVARETCIEALVAAAK